MSNSNTIKQLTLLSIIISSMIAGCAQNGDIPKPQQLSGQPVSTAKPNLSEHHDDPVKKKDLIIASPSDSEPVAHSDEDSDKAASTDSSKKTTSHSDYDITEPFDAQKLTLMGFSINDSIEKVSDRFGKPQAKSTMYDGTQTINVLEYPGFAFGGDDNHSIVFIEVNTDQINPGLNQFRLGQTVDEALKALGPASSLNDFVMIYESEGVILKFDLDPNNHTVLSIKLFAE